MAMRCITKKLKAVSFTSLLKSFLIGLIAINSIYWIQHLQKRNHEIIWKRNIFADASGYFVYLPSTFLYHFDAKEFSSKFGDRINNKGEMEEVGCGFRIENNKIITKYFYGIALLQTPIYLSIHLYHKISGKTGDGFNGLYEQTTIISSIIYFVISLILLYKFLITKTSDIAARAAIFFTVFGSNAIYYFGAYPGYTHPYLFFLIVCLLYTSYKFSQNQNIKNTVWLYIITGLIIITRPINIIVLAVFFIDNDFKKVLKLISPKKLILGIFILTLLIFPQLLYYKYISGDWFYYSYNNESFTGLRSPSLGKFYFSTNNGLFLYNPIWATLLLASAYLLFTPYRHIAAITLIIFVTNSYLCSSWHIWNFGCGYGSRNFVEYIPIFALPFALILDYIRSRWKLFIIIAASILFCYINFKFMYKYDKCYFGKGNWDIEYIKSFF